MAVEEGGVAWKRAINVIITGPSGFLGSHRVKALVAEGHRVIALKRRASDLQRLAAVRHLKLDCAKAKMRLGWRLCWNLEQALSKMVDFGIAPTQRMQTCEQ